MAGARSIFSIFNKILSPFLIGMSILATYASEYKNSINDENNFSSNTGPKKKMKNKTLKKKPPIKDNAKMEAMMNRIHNFDDEEEDDELTNFEPIAPPVLLIQASNAP